MGQLVIFFLLHLAQSRIPFLLSDHAMDSEVVPDVMALLKLSKCRSEKCLLQKSLGSREAFVGAQAQLALV